MQRQLPAGAVERVAQSLTVNRQDVLNLFGKPGHEALEGSAELLWVRGPEQPAEGVVAGQAVGEIEENAQEFLLCLREQGHVDRRLPAAQHGA